MKKPLSLAIAAGWLALTLVSPSNAATGYEAYYDLLNNSPWYDGVTASIQYQATAVDGEDLAVWIGLDNDAVADADLKWIQGGWGQQHDGQPLIYWEYVGADGVHHLGEDVTPGNNEVYSQQHQGNQALWQHGDTIYKQVNWSRFNGVTLRKGQYGAEMQPATDRTPGTVTSKNRFSSTQVRQVGAEFTPAPLAGVFSDAPNGNIEKANALPGSDFQTWDRRN